MYIPVDVICKVCKRVFCCADCRHKHEIKTHAIIVQQDRGEIAPEREVEAGKSTLGSSIIYLFCAICEARPLPLQEEMHEEMLAHIEQQHLPLHCRNCGKLYVKIDDLRSFSKCVQAAVPCSKQHSLANQTYTTKAHKVGKAVLARPIHTSTQTSPMPAHFHLSPSSDLTPEPFVNLRCKLKKGNVMVEEHNYDSAASIKNFSSINNSSMHLSVCVDARMKGKLVRSTSTPVQAELYFAKPKEPAFNGTAGHVSSIYNSVGIVDNSPPLLNPNAVSPKSQLDNLNRYRKMGGARSKLVAVTPLRHVMSKSIQKAIAEHGMPAATSPLDLRLSPVIRRTQSENNTSTHSELEALVQQCGSKIQQKIVRSSKKLTTESIVITRTKRLSPSANASEAVADQGATKPVVNLSDVAEHKSTTSTTTSTSTNGSSVSAEFYKSCQCSVEIITSTELNELNEVVQRDVYKKHTRESMAVPLEPPPQPSVCVKPPVTTKKWLEGSSAYNLSAITPISSIPGMCISKKAIRFETPQIEETTVESQDPNDTTNTTASDVFYTPCATPTRKPTSLLAAKKDGDFGAGRDCKQVVPRSLSQQLLPRPRPPLRECAQARTFSCAHYVHSDEEDAVGAIGNYNNNNDDDTLDLEDEVFLSTKENTPPRKENAQKAVKHDHRSNARSWSLGALLSSVMHLPTLIGSDGVRTKDDNFNSILKRCASIAGSLVRTKSVTSEAEENRLKRKRTNTMESPSNCCSPPRRREVVSPSCSVAPSKRFRVQARKPIERMRRYNMQS